MYACLHGHSEYSLLDGLSKAHQIAARCRAVGMTACALTDHGSVAGVVPFLKAMKWACRHCGYQGGKDGKPQQHADGGKGKCVVPGVACPGFEPAPMKPILGSEFYVVDRDSTVRDKTNDTRHHLCVLAKSLQGWKNLVKATSLANAPEHFYRKPRLDLDRLGGMAGGEWVAFSGHPGSMLADCLFVDPRAAYAAKTYDQAKGLAKPWPGLKRELVDLARRHEALFGRGNFFIEVQLIDAIYLPAAEVVAKAMRWLARETGIPPLATPDAHYPTAADAADQRVLLCASADVSLAEAERKLEAGEDFGLSGFFRSNRYHVPDLAAMRALHTDEELANTLSVAAACAEYDITSQPRLPQFPCPGGADPNDYLTELCRAGWGRKVAPVVAGRPDLEAVYRARLDRELGVLREAGLAPYFLIVHDICDHSQRVLGCKPSKGRGSAAGCLVTHLLNVADCDPIRYDLLFERFYNAGRNAPGRVSLPDIDMDFPMSKRAAVIEYVRAKYGPAHVAQMATFGRMQGRDALTTVLRAHQWGTFEQRKLITAHVPDESAIADELQEMREEHGDASIIQWALANEAEALKDWCELKPDGTLDGPLAPYFAQAIRIEGTKKSQGKHAAGVVIFPDPLADHFPMLHDKSTGLPVVGFEMGVVEACGGVKLDALGVAGLDKVMGAIRTVATGKVGVA